MRTNPLRITLAAAVIFVMAANSADMVEAEPAALCPCVLNGDINDDSVVDFYDAAAALVNAYSSGLTFHACDGQADVDGDGQAGAVGDYTRLNNYTFKSGNHAPAPCP